MNATLAKLVEAEPLRDATYVATAIACLLLGLLLDQRPSKISRFQSTFWLCLTTLLLILVAMKMLGVQFALLDRIREFAWADGWYMTRRSLQAKVILGILGTVSVFLLIVLYMLGRYRVSLGPPVVATTGLLTFILIRAISLHQVDSVIYRSDFAGVQVGALAELSLTLLIAATALFTWVFYVAFRQGDSGPDMGQGDSTPDMSSGATATLVLASGPAFEEPAPSQANEPAPENRRKRRRRANRSPRVEE